MKFLLLLFITILMSGCYTNKRECKDFKTGSFTSTVVIEEVTYISIFTRSESLQIETFEGKTDSSTVRWINDCEVIFHTISPKRMADKKDIHLKILTTTDSTYTFEYSYVGEAKKQRGIASKAK